MAASLRAGVSKAKKKPARRAGKSSAPGERRLPVLDVHRETFEAGDKSALLWALRDCCKENVALPAWARAGWVEVIRELEEKPRSLHNLLGLHKRKIRAAGKRALVDRERIRQSAQLWFEASHLVYAKKMSRHAAVKQVLRDGYLDDDRTIRHFPFKQREAETLYEERDSFYRRLKAARRR